ncbi:MAG: CCA tRNA nucleotidyltransferase [Rhizomicrobium sp.]
MKIHPARQAWMVRPATVKLMAALGQARFVGGAVRNALLNRPAEDIDIAVPMLPEEVILRLGKAAIKFVPTGLDHGTVTAIVDGQPFEVTSLRRDVKTDGRRAVVSYTANWQEDSARRDFTMNALYASPEGEIFDYHGGVEDLLAGRVRFVGDPAQRIKEDYLRILRLFRFHAWYGRGEMDGYALRAAAAAKSGLNKLSGERIAKELLRLLASPNPIPALRMMAASGLLSELLPHPLELARLEQLVAIDAENTFPSDALLRLGALLPGANDVAARVGERLKLSAAERARLQGMARMESDVTPLSAGGVRQSLYRLGPGPFRDSIFLRWAKGPRDHFPWRMLLSIADGWERPRFPLTGRDVIEQGVREGPEVGRVLEQLENWWLEQDFVPDQPALMDKLKSLLGPKS